MLEIILVFIFFILLLFGALTGDFILQWRFRHELEMAKIRAAFNKDQDKQE